VLLIERNQQHTGAMALLCLAYRELWPYSSQDARDLSAVSYLTQLATKADPVGPDGSTCRITQLIINGRFEMAHSMVKTVLAEHPESAVFYETEKRPAF